MALNIQTVPIEQIHSNPVRFRKDLESNTTSLADLALNIAEHGLLQPIIVKKKEDGGYLIVKGERRYQACIYNGAEKIGCIIVNSNESEIVGLSATLARKDLKETEKAEALHTIRTQYGYSNVALAKKLGISEGYVRKLLKIHDLPDDVKQDIQDGKTTAHEAVNKHKKSAKEQASTCDSPILLQLKKEKEMLVNALKQLALTESQQQILFQTISEVNLREEIKQAMGQ